MYPFCQGTTCWIFRSRWCLKSVRQLLPHVRNKLSSGSQETNDGHLHARLNTEGHALQDILQCCRAILHSQARRCKKQATSRLRHLRVARTQLLEQRLGSTDKFSTSGSALARNCIYLQAKAAYNLNSHAQCQSKCPECLTAPHQKASCSGTR